MDIVNEINKNYRTLMLITLIVDKEIFHRIQKKKAEEEEEGLGLKLGDE